jgi:hypothetical protein
MHADNLYRRIRDDADEMAAEGTLEIVSSSEG